MGATYCTVENKLMCNAHNTQKILFFLIYLLKPSGYFRCYRLKKATWFSYCFCVLYGSQNKKINKLVLYNRSGQSLL
jgi:hypothetical protein